MYCVFAFGLIVFQGCCINILSALPRHWLTDIDYNNPKNWNISHVPCETDTIIFPKQMEFAVELSSDITTMDLVLPNTGEILLGNSGQLRVIDKSYKSNNCKGEYAEFKKFRASYWVDAGNWDGWNKATPHTERIPCQSDRVIFPKDGTFRVIMPWETVQIAGLTIRDNEIDTFSWDEIRESPPIIEQFHKSNFNPGEFEISSLSAVCSAAGCECNNEYLKDSICEKIVSCEAIKCLNPIRPQGFCCDICGSFLSFNHKSSFRLNNLKKKLQNSIISKGWPVIWYVSRYGNTIQLILVEKGEYSGNLDDIANEINNILMKGNIGLLTSNVLSSGPVYLPLSTGWFFVRCFSTMALACLLFAGLFVYYYTSVGNTIRRIFGGDGKSFLFVRFENQSGEMRMRSMGEQSASLVSLPQAFDNPMYGTTEQDTKNTTVENPVYSELLKVEEEEEITEVEIETDMPEKDVEKISEE